MYKFRVKCSDGAVRHGELFFDSAKDALQWAQWEHCCLNTHSVQASPVSDLRTWTAVNTYDIAR